jgi:DNA polymerase-1
MKAPAVTTIDFETMPIRRRPEYPPVPVSVSIQTPRDKKPRWYAWGHPTENNCSKSDAARVLKAAWSEYPLLFQNAKFDYDVATTHLDMKPLSWDKLHDTLYLLFLQDPYAQLSLKPSAERLLGMPPEERDAVVDWLKKNLPFTRQRQPNGQYEKWEAYIAYAPGALVGMYACGDVTRTIKLFNKLYPEIVDRGMLDAYNVERETMPIMLANEREGIRVDHPLLIKEVAEYTKALETADVWLRKSLKSPNLNLNSDEEVAEAFAQNGWVDDDQWTITKGGKRSVSKKNLRPEMVNNKRGQQVFGYRNKLTTVLATMTTMEKQAALTSAKSRLKIPTIHTHWNQVKGDKGGAGTGRLSSTPNFQNISKDMEAGGDGFVHPSFLKSLPHLPLMRKFFLPDKGGMWIHRDYSQQELRILAHFEDGALLAAYNENYRAVQAGEIPESQTLDVHGIVDAVLKSFGLDFPRGKVKNVVFQKVYGGGLDAICAVLGCDRATAKKVIEALMVALPGYAELERDVKAEGRAGRAITTWGGREYFVRPAGYSERFKRFMTYEYMLLNYLIQGSAADCTKRALINYHNHPKRQARFLVGVHDELNASSPKARVFIEMKTLQECMADVDFALPMLSGGKVGINWASLKKVA